MSLLLVRVCRVLVFALLPTTVLPAAAQPWPAKSIRLVVPYPPGAGADLHARALAQKLTESLGHTVIVDNRGGANGVLAMIDLIAGQAQLSFLAWSTAGPFVGAGKLRALGVTSAKRAAALPDLPAIAETLPGYDITNGYAMAAPRGVQKQIVARVHAEIVRALAAADLRQAFEKDAIELVGSGPELLREYLKSELTKWAALVRSSGMKAD